MSWLLSSSAQIAELVAVPWGTRPLHSCKPCFMGRAVIGKEADGVSVAAGYIKEGGC